MSSYLMHDNDAGSTVSPLVASDRLAEAHDEEQVRGPEPGAVRVVGPRSLAAFYADVAPGSDSLPVAVNLSNAIVGAGIIGIPYAFMRSGFGFGLCLLAAMASLSRYSIGLLLGSGIALRARSYEDTAGLALGPRGEKAVLAGQFAFDYGAALSYLIIAADTSTEVARTCFGGGFDGDRAVCILALSLGAMLPLCLLRDISGLEACSSLSVGTVFVVSLMVLAKMVVKLNHDNDNGSGTSGGTSGFSLLPSSLSDVVFALGVFSFAFVCQDCVFLYYNTLQRGTPPRAGRVATGAVAGALLLSSFLGACGFLTFGDQTEPNLLNNFGADDPLATLMRALYVLTMVLTFPICVFVCRQVLHNLMSPRASANDALPDVRTISLPRHLAYTFALFLPAVCVVLSTSNLGVVMSLTGNVAGSALGYVLPGLVALSPRVRAARRADAKEEAEAEAEGGDGGGAARANGRSWLGELGPYGLVLFGAFAAVLGVVTVFV